MSVKKKVTQRLRDYLFITIGCAIYAAGISLFLDPNNLAPGGVSGVAIIIHEFVKGVGVGSWIVILNVPILIIGIIAFGFRFLISTIYAVAVSSVMMDVMSKYIGAVTDDLLLSVFAGAILVSAGIGIVFRFGATTGGTDIIVKLLKLKFRYLNTGTIFMLVDGVVVVASGLVFKNLDLALYAGIAVFIQMFALNTVLYGADQARLVYIISGNQQKIANRIMDELESGATFLHGRGAYTGDEKEVLMCVIRMRSLPEARDIVREEDEKAFMIVTSATSVFGEGYKSHESEEL